MPIFRIHLRLLVFTAAVLTLVSAADASQLLTRSALQTSLGGLGTLEDFESYSIGAATSDSGPALLDSTASFGSQGPGLVVPGVSFLGNTLHWNGVGHLGAPSREIWSTLSYLTIDFGPAVDAFGVDLRTFVGSPATVTMTIFSTDDTTVLGALANISLLTDGIPVFAGWNDSAGIGKVELTLSSAYRSAIIDNVEFGSATAAPEPSAFLLFVLGLAGLGIVALRRPRN